MTTLSYDLSVIGLNKVDAAFSHVERRAQVHNQRMMRPASTQAAGASQSAQHKLVLTHVKQEEAARLRSVRMLAAQKKHALVQAHKLELRQIEEAKQREIAAARAANARAAASSRNMRGAIGRGAIGSAAAIGRSATTIAGLGGTAIVASGIAKQIDASKQATALANKAFGTPGEERSREQIREDVMRQSKQIGDITGDRSGVIQAIDKFVAISGSLRSAQKLAPFMANISDATGAQMGDVGRTGGQILQNIMATRGVSATDTEAMNQALRDTQDIMLAMAGHAKIGSIEFADLATQMGKVMSSTARFDGKVADLANQMGAISQLAIAGGASSPEEAMTSILRFSDDLIQNAARFDALAARSGGKRSFFTDKSKTKLRDPTAIMMDILEMSKGDLTKVKKVFGIRAMKAVEPFQQAYVSARQRGATHEQAVGEVQTTIDRFKGAKMSASEAAQSATFARSQTGRSMQIEWEKLTQSVGEELAPALRDLLPSLKGLAGTLREGVPYLKWFFEELAANPVSTIGKVIAAQVTLSIARAAIGQAVANALTQQVAASGVSSALGGVAMRSSGASSALMILGGAAAAVGGALAAVAIVSNEAANAIGRGQNERLGTNIEGTNLVNQASARLRAGKSLTSEQREALSQYNSTLTEREKKRDQAIKQGQSIGGIAQTIGATFGLSEGLGFGESMRAMSGAPNETDVRNQAEIATIMKLDAAAQKSSDAAANQMRAAIELEATSRAIKSAMSKLHRGDKPEGPVK